MKRKTNEQKMRQLLKECDTRKLYENHFISPELIINTAKKIKNIL